VADVPSGLSLTPPQETKEKNGKKKKQQLNLAQAVTLFTCTLNVRASILGQNI
jgi:hypothetical protein